MLCQQMSCVFLLHIISLQNLALPNGPVGPIVSLRLQCDEAPLSLWERPWKPACISEEAEAPRGRNQSCFCVCFPERKPENPEKAEFKSQTECPWKIPGTRRFCKRTRRSVNGKLIEPPSPYHIALQVPLPRTPS